MMIILKCFSILIRISVINFHYVFKTELHAHLNGSLSEATLRELFDLKSNTKPEHSHEESLVKYGDFSSLDSCFDVFRIAHSLVDTPTAVSLATARTIVEFHKDGCVYLELRSTPRSTAEMTKKSYIEAIVEGIRNANDLLGKSTITTRLIVSIDRSKSIDEATENVDAAIAMAELYPEIICGIDVSGDPKKGTFGSLIPLLDKARATGLKVTLHLAEIPETLEILKMLKWRPDRVGHAVFIHPDTGGSQTLWDHFLQAKIPTEMCLTSNIKCKLIDEYHTHHFKYFWEKSHPISIATDDKGVFSTTLSREYELCAETFNINIPQLLDLAESAVNQTFASAATRNNLKNIFKLFRSTHLTA